MKMYSKLLFLFLVSCSACHKSPEQKMAAAKDKIATAKILSQLQVRGELGYAPNESDPYSGWAKKLHDRSEQVQCLLRLDEGQPKEILIFYANGVPASVMQIGKIADLAGLIKSIERSNLQPLFADIKPEGIVTLWHENGQKASDTYWSNGKKNGLATLWYKNGQKCSEIDIKDDMFVSASVWKPNGEPCPFTKMADGSGVFATWHENGKRSTELYFKDSKKHGPSIAWTAQGEKIREQHYKNDEQEGPFTLYYDGKKAYSGNRSNGELNGVWNCWWDNGKKMQEIIYDNGNKISYADWSESGKKTQEVQYKNGKVISRKEF